MRSQIDKYILLFTVYLIGSTMVTAQLSKSFPDIEDSVKWNVIECFWLDCDNNEFTYNAIVELCGFEYYEVWIEDYGKFGYVRIDGEQVYGRGSKDCGQREYLLYDFSIQPGESVYVGFNISQITRTVADTNLFVAVSIDTVQLEQRESKRIKLIYNRCLQERLIDTMYWIRGVGSVNHPFYSFKCLCSACEEVASLRCMRIEGVEEYKSHPNADCDEVIVSNQENRADRLKVFPNPYTSTLQIESSKIVRNMVAIGANGKRLEITQHVLSDRQRVVNFEDLNYRGLVTIILELEDSHRIIRTIKL